MKKPYALSFLTLGGTLFAGYLAGDKFFNDHCTIGTSCASFLGYPTCYYGFGLFAILFMMSLLYTFTQREKYTGYLSVVSAIGILFSAYFTLVEVAPLIRTGTMHFADIPSCAYGLIGFILTLIIARKKCRYA